MTPKIGVRLPAGSAEGIRELAGRPDVAVGAIVRAGLQLLRECPPEKARELLDANTWTTHPSGIH